MTTHRVRRFAAAFTLIELLVVITIIGVLAALLFPTLRGALSKSQQTVALNNLRQIGTATIAYTGEHENQLPSRNVGAAVRKWPELLLPYLGLTLKDGPQPTYPVPKSYRIPIETPATGYAVIDDSSLIDSSNGNILAIVMNGYNDLGAYDVKANEPPVEVRVNRLAKPSEVILLGLKLPKKDDYYMDFSEGQNGNNVDVLNTSAFNGGSNYLFADGHAGFIKQSDYRKPYVSADGTSSSYSYGDWLWLADKEGGAVIKPPKS